MCPLSLCLLSPPSLLSLRSLVSRPFPLPELSRFVAIQLLTLPRNCYRVFPNLIPTAQTILLEDEDDREKRGGGKEIVPVERVNCFNTVR